MPPLHPSSLAEDRLALLQTHDDAVIAGSRNRQYGRPASWSSMPVETPSKHKSRLLQPEARSGPPLLSRHSRAFAK